MSGIGFFELAILFLIGLVVLGPKRLPKVANQLGTWVGQARRMTRVMKRQLEDELDLDEDLRDLKNIGKDLKDDLTIGPEAAHIPRDDDSYSPLHDEPDPVSDEPAVDTAEDAGTEPAETAESAEAEEETAESAEAEEKPA